MFLAANEYQDGTKTTEIYTATAQEFVDEIEAREIDPTHYVRML
jgi:hypothetical protein